jgi:hypothetical protein
MKRLITIASATLLMTLAVSAQSSEDLSHHFGTNGLWRSWNALTELAKNTYVQGYREGADYVAKVVLGMLEPVVRRLQPSDTDEKRKLTADLVIKALTPSKLTNGEIRQQVDLFYQDTLNIPITVTDAMLVVAKQASGASAAEIDKHIRDLRREASGLPAVTAQVAPPPEKPKQNL